jgi:predicted alpha/beta-fold hydrolase
MQPYLPPLWLRNGHLQSALSSSRLRQRRGAELLAATGASHQELLLDGGDGVRLQAWLSHCPAQPPRGLALLLHGWEGSAESGYMRMSAAHLLQAGFSVVRLNFRDHGGTFGLNPGIFHSARIGEVVNATADLAARHAHLPLVVAGFSLGGNFALRLGLRAPAAGIDLCHVVAVCPVLDPATTMDSMEAGLALYSRYFHRKWTDSLRRKRALFPEQMAACDEHVLSQDLRSLTGWLAQRYAGFDDAHAYFE